MKKHVLILLISIVLFSCRKNEKTKLCYSNSNVQTLNHNNEPREYIRYIPSSYDGTSPIPLLFNFHGFGESASKYIDYADMRALAESDTFILVYPQGSCSEGYSHWNPSLPGGGNKSSADDFGFIEAIIKNFFR